MKVQTCCHKAVNYHHCDRCGETREDVRCEHDSPKYPLSTIVMIESAVNATKTSWVCHGQQKQPCMGETVAATIPPLDQNPIHEVAKRELNFVDSLTAKNCK